MKKNYLTMLFAMFSIAMFGQITTVSDTIWSGNTAMFYADYTANAGPSNTTFTLTISDGAVPISAIQEVEIYKSSGNGASGRELRLNGRTRIQRFISTGNTGTVVFTDNFDTYTADANAPSGFGYTGNAPFTVGKPVAYSVKIIYDDNGTPTGLNSTRIVQSVFYDEANPDSSVFDPINADVNLWTRVYENTDDTALLVMGLAPSANFPSGDPFQYFTNVVYNRSLSAGKTFADWAAYPTFVSETKVNEVPALAGRVNPNGSGNFRIFFGGESFAFLLVDIADVPAAEIDANGFTHLSFKFGRPSINGTVSTPMKIQNSTASVDDVAQQSTIVRAINNKIDISNVNLTTEVNIYNLAGALVKTITATEDMSFDFQSGFYIATVSNAEAQNSVKLIVQ